MDEALAAVRKYGIHKGRCRAFPATSEEQIARDCDCGLQSFLALSSPAVMAEGKKLGEEGGGP